MCSEGVKKYPYFFIIYYLLHFSGFALFGVFIPIYLDSINYSQAAIGFLISIGPVVTIIGQPVWGSAADRAKNKVNILRTILIGTVFSIIIFSLSTNYIYLIVAISILTFFQSALSPLSSAITLEYTERTGWKFGPIRVSGTLGYGIMAAIAGILLKNDMRVLFIMYVIVTILAVVSTYMFPRFPGHQTEKSKVPMFSLLKSKKILKLMLFVLITHTFICFYDTFFSIYFKSLGAGNTLVGLSVALSALSEIPFIFFGDKILEKLGAKRAISCATLLLGVRWLLLGFVTAPYIILLLQLLHGPALVFLTFSIIVYVNSEMPKELKASGQALYFMIYAGIAKIIGSALGGVLSDSIGVRNVFLIGFVMTVAAIAIFKNLFSNDDESLQVN